MSNEVYAFALKSTLDEIQKACPGVTSSFIFKDGKLIAKNQNTKEDDVIQTINAFDAITERVDPIGGVETITIQSAEGKVAIATTNDFYLTTVSSKEADEKYVNTLTRILIPIVIRLSERIQPASGDSEAITIDQPEPEEDDAAEATEEAIDATEEVVNETSDEETAEFEDNETDQPEEFEEETAITEPEEIEQVEPEIDTDPLLPEPPVTQLIVENLSGLLVPSDTVRVDQEVIKQWSELYGDKKIKEVEVEALNGKTILCKFKKIKKSKDAGKGIVKMPEKIQLTLETQEGELVTVKPIVE
jgi:predicted regulator of Ras-like GTPase activity (Roadblock/LC7/MglB family)